MQILLDLRYAARAMRRAPAFTAAALLSLALGIGANTAIFSLIHTLLLRPLPVHEPRQLVEFLVHYPGDPALNNFSLASFQHFRDQNHVFAGVTAESGRRVHVLAEGIEPQAASLESVAGNFFPLLGLKPAIGRLIGPADETSQVAVLTWSFWKSRFHLDPSVLGKRLTLDNVSVTVIGVTARDFTGLQTGAQPDFFLPLSNPTGLGALRLIARLKPGVSLAEARAEMAVLFRYTFEERTKASRDPVMRQLRFTVEPAGTGVSTPLRAQFAKPLLALLALVALLLLIACGNLATMLLARGAARRREMTIRASLGATQGRLIRQVVTESLLLSVTGGLLGILVAYIGAGALVRMVTSGRFVGGPPHIDILSILDTQVLLFTAAVSVLTGLFFGLAPAWNVVAAARTGDSRSRRLFGRTLVVAQVALSVVILSAAGVFVDRLVTLKSLDLGFRRDHILLVSIDSGLAHQHRELLDRLEALPGVRSATISAPSPLSGAGAPRLISAEGFRERPEDRRYTHFKWVAPRYFETFDSPLVAGRDFTFEDQGRPRVAIVNQALARYYFADANPIGKHLTVDSDSHAYEVVGVARDERYYEILESPRRMVYLNAFQEERVPTDFAIRTNIDPAAVAPEARRAVRDFLPGASISRLTTLTDQIDATIVPERLIATLSGWFGALGSLLAALGIYGLLAYTVARRTNEIGIRMALGATRARVLGMVFRDALLMLAAGLVIGAPLAGLIPGGAAGSIAFAVAAMVLVGLAAACLPALRASRIEPIEALRQE